MAAIVGTLADAAYVTSDNPRTEDPQRIIDEIVPGFSAVSGCRVVVEVDRRRAIQAAITGARPGDTVLIAGKGHEPYQLVGDTVLPFDDVAVARECLNRRAHSRATDPTPKRVRGGSSPVGRTSPVGPTFQSVKSQAQKPLPHEELA